MLLVDDLLLLPVSGLKFVLRTLQQVAEDQYTDSGAAKERLLELQLQLESGEVSDEEYREAEAAIFRELREIEQRKRTLSGPPAERE